MPRHRDVEARFGQLRAPLGGLLPGARHRFGIRRRHGLGRSAREVQVVVGVGMCGHAVSELAFAESFLSPILLSSPRMSFPMLARWRAMRTALMTTTAAKSGPAPRKNHAATGAKSPAVIAPSEE